MSHLPTLEISLADEAATEDFARHLGRAVEQLHSEIVARGFVVALLGDLGAGKTALVRALLRSLGVQGTVKSPSYALLEPYEVLKLNFYHFDFYRFKSPLEFQQAGFAEYFGAGKVCFVEWPEHAGQFLPPVDCRIELRIDDARAARQGIPPRLALVQACTSTGERCVGILKDLPDPTRAGA
jgi:tRNA threonylcarbamoyladenosine biosynthesis protein TsaE